MRAMDPLRAWGTIPRRIRKAVSGLSPRELRVRGGSESWTIREYAHHLVEANLVASSIIVAALGSPGARYDWSWLYPDERWMSRLRYDTVPLQPAIDLLDALCAHVAGIVRNAPGAMSRHVRLVGTRRVARRTVRQILAEECEHARHHLGDIARVKSASRPR